MNKIANRYMPQPEGWERTMYKNGDVQDIIEVILIADKLSPKFTKELAQQLRQGDDYDTLHAIWHFVKQNVRYVRDKVGHEVIQLPGALWRGRRGDCKSFSVFIGSLLKNLGYKYRYRVAFYNPSEPDSGHIYPIVKLPDGRDVVLDAVHSRFDDEVRFWTAKDYYPGSGYSRKATAIAGISPDFWQKFKASLQEDSFWISLGHRIVQGLIIYIALDLLIKPTVEKRRSKRRELTL